jgi:hypothetical protein
MKQNKLYIVFIVISLILFSCGNNSVCFEEDTLNIVSIKNQKLTKIYVDRKNEKGHLQIINNDYDKALSTIKISRSRINGYNIKIEGNVFTEDGKLFPNSTYTIENYSLSGADIGIVSFTTDIIGRPIEVSNLCK